jgi:class 3 adenylate cyclase/tetratricopeptide (TPR) repeat protein
MRCAKCGAENPAGKRFCGDCGAPLANRCEQCGAENPPGKKFCGDCGSALGTAMTAAVAPSSPPRSAPNIGVTPEQPDASATLDGERKTVTALFADIKGSTELMEDLDPEEARAIIDPALKLMIDAVHRYDGYVVQSTGDGIFALFGAPVAHEDHPQRALYAALRIQEELRRYSAQVVADGGLPIEARVGVNTGEVVVRSITTGAGQVEYTPIGHTTNLASRMQAVAPTGSIAVSEHTRKLCEGYFILKPLGPTRVKGVSEPVNVYEVTGLGPLRTRLQRSAGRGLTKFVGREREMEALRHAAEQAKGGRGQIVAAMAEAGVGKSRLYFEFKAKNQSGWTLLETFSVSHGKASAYFPVLDLLQGYFKIASEDDERTRREKVNGKILTLDRALEDTVPYLFSLLGIVEGDDPLAQMDGQIRKRRTLEAIKRILLRESLNQPLMVIFEDLHWIDDATQELLNLLADGIAKARVLMMVNYRPEYHHEWSNRTHYTQLRLDLLGKESAGEMLSELLGDAVELNALKRRITQRTEGNPFFIEEVVQALFDEGVLVRNGAVKVTRSLAQVHLPTTVQGMLAARIDRLPAEQKELLQTLAVLGREFPLGLIRRVAKCPDEELDRALADLQIAEFIYEQSAFPEVEYIFKHALTQEVAYSSLLIERRKLSHELAAQALEALFVDCIDDHLAAVTHHYSRSGNGSKAVEYLVRAGEQALQRSTFAEATTYFENGLARLEQFPADAERDRKEIAIRRGLADVTIVTSGYAAAEYEHHLTRRYELALQLGDNTQLFYSLVGVSVLSAFRLELGKAHEIGGRLLALADQALDPQMQLQAHGSLANILWLLGDFRGSLEHSERGLALYALNECRPSGEEHMRAACLFFASLCTAALGFPDKALQRSLEFLAWAQEQAQPLSLAFAMNCLSTVFGWRRQGGEALKYADALLALTVEQGFSNWHSFAQIDHGQALALLGQGDDAIAEIKNAIASYEATGAVVPGWVHSTLAFAYLVAKQPAEGLRVVVRGLNVGDQTDDGEAKAELHRLKGELLLCDPTAMTGAETSFRAAISTARKQAARLSELRATTSLARLLVRQGKRNEARTTLGDIYNWFTEGFDTADLKDAKALLEELGA